MGSAEFARIHAPDEASRSAVEDHCALRVRNEQLRREIAQASALLAWQQIEECHRMHRDNLVLVKKNRLLLDNNAKLRIDRTRAQDAMAEIQSRIAGAVNEVALP